MGNETAQRKRGIVVPERYVASEVEVGELGDVDERFGAFLLFDTFVSINAPL